MAEYLLLITELAGSTFLQSERFALWGKGVTRCIDVCAKDRDCVVVVHTEAAVALTV